MTPQKLLSFCLWSIVIVLVVPLYLRAALDDPADYVRGGVGANDFKAYYIAARLLARGQDIYSQSLSEQEMDTLRLPRDKIVYMYPSMIAISTLPLTNVSLENAARIWNLINLGWLVGALVCITATLNLRRVLGSWYVWFVILFAISVPATGAIRVGQANVLLLFLLSLALYAQVRQRPALAGIAIAIAAMIKVFPAVLFLWWLWKRQWQSLIWGIGTLGVILLLCGLFMIGTGRDPATDVRFFIHVLPQLSAPIQNDNQSLYGFFSHYDLGSLWTRIGASLICLLIVVGTVWTLARAPKDTPVTMQYGLIITALLLVSTITWSTTNILLLIPIAVLVQHWTLQRRARSFFLALGVVYFLLGAARWFASPAYPPFVFASILGLGSIGMAILWGLLVYESLSEWQYPAKAFAPARIKSHILAIVRSWDRAPPFAPINSLIQIREFFIPPPHTPHSVLKFSQIT